MTGFARPELVVSTEWLAGHLHDPHLRILDCTVYLHVTPEGGNRAESGRANYDKGHIPGAAFADLLDDLCAPHPTFRFLPPTPEHFAAAMGRLGVGPGTRAVLYSDNGPAWAARVWWMLRAYGFDDAVVLDGGWRKWTLEGRPVSTEPAGYPPAAFVARPRPEIFVDKDQVLGALGDKGVCLLNSLSPEQHAGTAGVAYGRPGRIPGSVNVPARDLIDAATQAYKPAGELRALFRQAGALEGGRVVTYCGGGIAASSDALILRMLGLDDVAIYAASMQEWSRDPSLPMERG